MAPLSDKLYWTVVALITTACFAVTTVLLWPHPKPVVEVAQPAVVQSDGSTILERTDTQPNAKSALKRDRPQAAGPLALRWRA